VDENFFVTLCHVLEARSRINENNTEESARVTSIYIMLKEFFNALFGTVITENCRSGMEQKLKSHSVEQKEKNRTSKIKGEESDKQKEMKRSIESIVHHPHSICLQ
jgi:L-rhamnose mutarotase